MIALPAVLAFFLVLVPFRIGSFRLFAQPIVRVLVGLLQSTTRVHSRNEENAATCFLKSFHALVKLSLVDSVRRKNGNNNMSQELKRL